MTSTSSGLSLGAVNGATEFSGAAFDGGIYSGTIRSGLEVVLSGASGTYTSPPVNWNGVSYGRLVANLSLPAGASLSFDILNATLVVVQSDVRVSEAIIVDGSVHSSIRIRSMFEESATALSPRLSSIGAGYIITAPIEGMSAAQRAQQGFVSTGAGIEIPFSTLNFTTPFATPVISPVASTWYSLQVSPRSAVAVGSEIWLYVSAYSSTTGRTIGRFVSSNGGATWTPDAGPLLYPTALSWDRDAAEGPTVLREGPSSWKMYYVGWDQRDWADGAQIGLATSSDGLNWTKSPSNPVLSPSSSGWDNRHVTMGGVVKEGSTYYLSYSGLAQSGAHSVGMATSSDGVTWTRYSGNPVISSSTAPYAAGEALAGALHVFDGVFHQYWLCLGNQPGSRLSQCVATSTDGFAWAQYSGNPIIIAGESTYNAEGALMLSHVASPVDGRPVWLFQAVSAGNAFHVGRAFPIRVSPSSVEFDWDLRDEVPARFISYQLNASLPASTAVSSAMSTASQSGTFSLRESLSNPDSSISTPADERLKLNLTASTSVDNSTPRISAFRLAYERIGAPGSFVSAPMSAPAVISEVTITYAGSVPSGTSASIEVSNDDGQTWASAAFGAPHAFAQPGNEFRYRIVLTGTTTVTPVIGGVDAHLTLLSNPADVRLETEGGSLMAMRAGALTAPASLALDATTLNAQLAPFASNNPPRPVPIAILVNSSSPGLLTLSDLHVNLTFADPLVAHFGPVSTVVTMEVGEEQWFQVWASTTAGVPLTYHWWIDGVPAGDASDRLGFAPGAPGTYDIRAMVTNGQRSSESNWTVAVSATTIVPSASFFPGIANLTLHVGASQGFWAQVEPATVAAVVQWRLDGTLVSGDSSFTYLAAPPTGAHVLGVTLTAGSTVLSQLWNITVTEVTHLPSRELGVAFAPASDLTLRQNETGRFFANLTEAAGPPIVYEWHIHGGLSGTSDVGQFDVVGSTPGIYAVWVTVRNETGVAAHFWNLTILPPPQTLQNQSGNNGGNQSGDTVDTGTPANLVLMALTVLFAAVTALTLALYLRERKRGRGG